MRITELQIGSIQENDYLAADESTYGTRKILLSDVIAMAKDGLVPYDAEIELTPAEMLTARANMGAIAMADLPAASTTQAGIAQLSAAVDSTDDTKAATPSAVKAAYDLADSKAALVDGKVSPSESSAAYVSISASTELSNSHAGKVLLIGASATLTFGTLADGAEIEIWNTSNYTVTIQGTVFVSGNGMASSCTIDDFSVCTIKKMSNTIYIAGGVSV